MKLVIMPFVQKFGDRKEKEDAFYNSDDWQHGPRKAILALIEHMEDIVIPEETFMGWPAAIRK